MADLSHPPVEFTDLEIIVLRHQPTALHRQNNRPALADEDRALPGAIAAALPRPQRAGWLVTPSTRLVAK